MNRALNSALIGLSAITLAGLGSAAQAVNIVQNGSFETYTQLIYRTASPNGVTTGGYLDYHVSVNGWTNSTNTNEAAYGDKAKNVLVNSGEGEYTVPLYGPQRGYQNGLPASSPDGGNYMASDGDYHYGGVLTATLIQSLIEGHTYELKFYEAAAQQWPQPDATTDQWHVTLGTQTQKGKLFSIPQAGFAGWSQKTMTFTATAADVTAGTLKFLAVGTPANGAAPPFSLLDGVSLTDTTSVPEPLTILGTGVVLSAMPVLKKEYAKRKKKKDGNA